MAARPDACRSGDTSAIDAAHPVLLDWLDTAPNALAGVRRALVLGDRVGARLLAAEVDLVEVDRDEPAEAGGQEVGYDLVAVVDRLPAGDGALADIGGAVGAGGCLLLIATAPRSGASSEEPLGPAEFSVLAAAGLQLVSFEDLTGGAGPDQPGPRQWLRVLYRRLAADRVRTERVRTCKR